MVAAVVVAEEEEEEEGSLCGGFFSVGSATATADCDMQPMEKGKTAKRSPPPELPRRSFIVAFDLQGGARAGNQGATKGRSGQAGVSAS